MKSASTALNTSAIAPAGDDHPELSRRNTRAGLVLFFVYLACYALFMGLAAFAPQAMAQPEVGINLAIASGMGLIIGAFVIAALYMWACARNARLVEDEFATRPSPSAAEVEG
jgi:uncharacterized membrane protein (DUF485 family)